MRTLLGIFRLSLAVPVIVLGSFVIVLVALFPIRFKRIHLAAWLCTGVSRLALIVFNFRYRCIDPVKIRTHTGFVLANHITFFDILMLMAVMPLRFLSAAENRSWPFIGWVAAAVGTVFVDRGSKESRAAAREALIKADKFPPIVVYPEGGVGPIKSLQPFRYGLFEICVEYEFAYLPVGIVYSQPEVVGWGQNESFIDIFWRTACCPGPIDVSVTPLEVVPVKRADDAKLLAANAHRSLAQLLGVQPQM
jgi:1-acyl-sn-glycerol-3-phosphate acyltransferase